jgi:hypothetical protein
MNVINESEELHYSFGYIYIYIYAKVVSSMKKKNPGYIYLWLVWFAE